jgi:hypothetical protein
MLTLIQCAAVILCAVLVVTVVRLARGSLDDGEKNPVESVPITRFSTGPQFPSSAAPSTRPVAGLASDSLAPSHAADRATGPVVAGLQAGDARWPATPDWPASPARAARPATTDRTSAPDERAELWSLVIRLRQRAEELRAECTEQRAEIAELRALVADAAREVAELQAAARSATPRPGSSTTSEPRLPRTNVYALKALR